MMSFNRELLKKDMKTVFPVSTIIIVIIAAENFFLGKICPMRMLTGMPCPGCGLTRAFLLLLQGKVREATAMHPFWIAVLLLFFIFIGSRYWISDEENRNRINRQLVRMSVIVLIGMVLYYFYRMFTVYPGVEPMVYDKENLINEIKETLKSLTHR